MEEDGARRFDKTTRDYHHALRRKQRGKEKYIAKWTIVIPWLAAFALILAVSSLW
jgi:hypothetical protein